MNERTYCWKTLKVKEISPDLICMITWYHFHSFNRKVAEWRLGRFTWCQWIGWFPAERQCQEMGSKARHYCRPDGREVQWRSRRMDGVNKASLPFHRDRSDAYIDTRQIEGKGKINGFYGVPSPCQTPGQDAIPTILIYLVASIGLQGKGRPCKPMKPFSFLTGELKPQIWWYKHWEWGD